MITVTMPKAQEQLPDLLLTAEAGEEVEIVADSGRTFRLAVQAKPAPVLAANPDWPGYPHPGSGKGLIEVADDFDAPLDELKEYSTGATRPRPPVTGIPLAGRLRGQLVVPADFDAPLEELREYME